MTACTDQQSADRTDGWILVTGASGKIGRCVVADLVQRGYRVRGLTTQPIEQVRALQPEVQWHRFDWQQSLDVAPFVEGCCAVIHLGAEITRSERMQRSNVEATEALVKAAEDAGVKFFCYVSSVAVYGSALHPIVTEHSPVLTWQEDVRGEYYAEENLRRYGRTKLAGEFKIREHARAVIYVILRPTVVVGLDDIIGVGSWSRVKKAVASYRHAHQIYIWDVVHAIVWFMEKCLDQSKAQPSVSVYNLSNDDADESTYAAFCRDAYRKTGDPRFRTVSLPPLFDTLRDVLKFKMLPVRYGLGKMRFSSDKLYSIGYRHRYGIGEARRRALEMLDTHERKSE